MSTAIVWLRNTLRVHDNPLLHWACESDEVDSVIPLFVMDPSRGVGGEEPISDTRMGSCTSRWSNWTRGWKASMAPA